MSSKTKILNFRNFIYDKIDYYLPQKTKNKELITTVSYRLTQNQQIPIYLETPKLKTTSGIIKEGDDYYIDLEIDISNNTSDFFDFLHKIDEKNISTCHLNSCSWFNQTIPLETIEDYYVSAIKIIQDNNKNQTNPIMRLKIPTIQNKLFLEVYNEQKKQIKINNIEKNDYLVGIIRFVGLKFLNKQFQSVWEIFKINLLKEIEEENLTIRIFI